jgi:hypothetical protein
VCRLNLRIIAVHRSKSCSARSGSRISREFSTHSVENPREDTSPKLPFFRKSLPDFRKSQRRAYVVDTSCMSGSKAQGETPPNRARSSNQEEGMPLGMSVVRPGDHISGFNDGLPSAG